jgi:hypothetical protein
MVFVATVVLIDAVESPSGGWLSTPAVVQSTVMLPVHSVRGSIRRSISVGGGYCSNLSSLMRHNYPLSLHPILGRNAQNIIPIGKVTGIKLMLV